jgi:hypothetical protein
MLRRLEAIGLAFVALVSISKVAMADAFDGTYRGMIVCEKLKTSQFMLRAPLDIIVNGKTAIAARPIFNLKGTLVVGSEIATGTVADDGTIKLNSNWEATSKFQGSYSGVLTNKTATLTGTQAWTTSEGEQQTRACTAAVVHTPS